MPFGAGGTETAFDFGAYMNLTINNAINGKSLVQNKRYIAHTLQVNPGGLINVPFYAETLRKANSRVNINFSAFDDTKFSNLVADRTRVMMRHLTKYKNLAGARKSVQKGLTADDISDLDALAEALTLEDGEFSDMVDAEREHIEFPNPDDLPEFEEAAQPAASSCGESTTPTSNKNKRKRSSRRASITISDSDATDEAELQTVHEELPVPSVEESDAEARAETLVASSEDDGGDRASKRAAAAELVPWWTQTLSPTPPQTHVVEKDTNTPPKRSKDAVNPDETKHDAKATLVGQEHDQDPELLSKKGSIKRLQRYGPPKPTAKVVSKRKAKGVPKPKAKSGAAAKKPVQRDGPRRWVLAKPGSHPPPGCTANGCRIKVNMVKAQNRTYLTGVFPGSPKPKMIVEVHARKATNHLEVCQEIKAAFEEGILKTKAEAIEIRDAAYLAFQNGTGEHAVYQPMD